MKKAWFTNAGHGDLENMKLIYEIIKERGVEGSIKAWRSGDFDNTVSMKATMEGRTNILRWLIQELKVDINEQNNVGQTALHVAAYKNQLDCAQIILERDPQFLKDLWNDTPLDDAKKTKHKYIEELLESHFHLR